MALTRFTILMLAPLLLLTVGCTQRPERNVLFLGIDGATWKLIGPMIERGELPAFRRLRDGGAFMPQFETISTTRSPVVWTTVATGRRPEIHGVLDFTDTLPSGEKIPVSSNSRRAKAIWEIASEHDVSVGVVNWWASWPAEPVNGYVVTDHANPAHSEFYFETRDEWKLWTVNPETLERLRLDFYPPEIAATLGHHWIKKEDFSFDDLETRSKFRPIQMRHLQDAPWTRRTPYSMLKAFYRMDAPLVRAALELRRERPTRLQMLYLRGPDPIQHYAWDTVEPEAFPKRPVRLDRDKGLVEGVYRYLDSFLGEILDAIDDNTWLIVASDHGAEAAPNAAKMGRKGRPGTHTRAAKGVLFVYGPHVQVGHEISDGNPYDLFPTIAWLLGLPLSEELPGEILTDAFEPAFVRKMPVSRIDSYGDRQIKEGLPSAADGAMLNSLRTLGYLQ